MANADRKRELIAELDRARSRFTANQRRLPEDIQVGDKLKEGFKEHRGVFLGTAALLGLLISKIPPRTKKLVIRAGGKSHMPKETKEAGKFALVIMAMKYVFDLVRPMLLKWGTQRLTQALSGAGSSGGYRRY